jgi:hypothetical protein
MHLKVAMYRTVAALGALSIAAAAQPVATTDETPHASPGKVSQLPAAAELAWPLPAGVSAA